ncbi:trichohyalin-like [Elysia marginata]|uniref:Trichohyalin-like n=1 Tax=Elysia marginata TaxID=1093978 RepID=A0AAV4I3S0_9GAST|nr:trichohyalin-like [Elysia marginata]
MAIFARRPVAKLRMLELMTLPHSAYSPNLAPADYYSFPQLKKCLQGHHYDNDEGVIANEQSELLKRLSNLEDGHEQARQRHLELLRLRREERRLRQEDTVNAAMLLIGIAQKQHDSSVTSKEDEKSRQQELARQRLEMLQQCQRLQKDNLVRGESVLLLDDMALGDESSAEGRMDDLVLGLLDVRHARERNMLLKLMDDHSNEGTQYETQGMKNDDIRDNLQEKWELFSLWRNSEPQRPSDGETILVDSVGLSVEWKRRKLETEKELLSNEDVKVALLAHLQEVQETEAAQAMLMLIDVNDHLAEKIAQNQQQKLNNPNYENLASVLLDIQDEEEDDVDPGKGDQDEMEEEEKTVIKALEKKFDAMKDKLLIEALIREMGEADWSRLSDLERQKKLLELKMRERRLRREGKMDELAGLLGNFAEDSDRLSQILGETAEDQKRKVMEKIALRKRLKEEKEAQGQMIVEEELDKLVEEESKKIQAANIFNLLDKGFEAEKEALLSALRNQPDHAASEKKRQHELARIKREERMLKKEERLDSAAMVFALGEQNLKAHAQSLMSEKERQRELACQRLEALKQRKAEKLGKPKSGESDNTEEADGPLDVTDESAMLQNDLISSLERIQSEERSMLVDLISSVDLSRKAKEMASLSNNDLQQKLHRIQKEHEAWEAKTAKSVQNHLKLAKLPNKDKSKFKKDVDKRRDEQASILKEALSIKLELENRRLTSLQPNATIDEIKEELSICSMLVLQERQQRLLASTQERMKEESVEELKKSLDQQKLASEAGMCLALSATCFNVSMASELADMMKSKSAISTGEESKDSMELFLADEYQLEKEELIQRGKTEGINIDAALKRLGDQYEERKQALDTDLARQQADLRERISKRRKIAEEKAWANSETANQILASGSANLDSVEQAKTQELKRQDTLLQQRLQERRAARKALKSLPTKDTETESQGERSESDDRLVPLATDRKVSMPSLTREKTVVDVNVTEDEKQAMYDQLLQQERFKHNQITAAQARQEMMLKKRLEDRSSRRENEIAALFSLGERQKTTLQEFKKGERERQLAQMQDRMARMRESRSQSPDKRDSRPKLSK